MILLDSFMTPVWAPAMVGVLGVVANSIWTIINMQMKEGLLREIAALKVDLSKEYVSESVYGYRHAEIKQSIETLSKDVAEIRGWVSTSFVAENTCSLRRNIDCS